MRDESYNEERAYRSLSEKPPEVTKLVKEGGGSFCCIKIETQPTIGGLYGHPLGNIVTNLEFILSEAEMTDIINQWNRVKAG